MYLTTLLASALALTTVSARPPTGPGLYNSYGNNGVVSKGKTLAPSSKQVRDLHLAIGGPDPEAVAAARERYLSTLEEPDSADGNHTTLEARWPHYPTKGAGAYMCKEPNWAGECEWRNFDSNVCYGFERNWDNAIMSFGTDKVENRVFACVLFDDVSCTGEPYLAVTWPGYWHVGPLAKKASSIMCVHHKGWDEKMGIKPDY